MKDIAIFGAGGLGKEVACLVNKINEQEPTWNMIGFFDDNPDLKGKIISHFGPFLTSQIKHITSKKKRKNKLCDEQKSDYDVKNNA